MEDHTFVFVDIAGFTALTEAHGDARAADLVDAFCRSVGELLVGRPIDHVKEVGDAVLLRADEAAVAIEVALAAVEGSNGRHGLPLVRAGLHTGTAVPRGGDWVGAAVNLAARVTARALGGEILVTDDTLAAGAPPGLVFEDRGLQRFRHVAQPVRIYSAGRPGDRPPTLPIDPVCHMAVDPARARRIADGEHLVHLCSKACEDRWRADPAAYERLGGE